MKYGLVFLIPMLFFSCEFLDPETPPYLVSGIRVLNGKTDGQKIASVYFFLQNRGSRQIVSFDVELDVYDTEDKPQPQIGTNHVETSLSTALEAKQESEFQISLDQLFYGPPENLLTITRFCILRINYADGSSWEDKYKQFLIMADSVVLESAE